MNKLNEKVKNAATKVKNFLIEQNAGDVEDVNSERFLEWLGFGNIRKGKPENEATYFTCLKMLSEGIAKMPIKYYQKTSSGIVEAQDTAMSYLLKKRPNPYMTPTTFWNTVEINRNHHGNAFVYIEQTFNRKKYGGEITPNALWIMPSKDVNVLIDDVGIFGSKGRIWYKYRDRYSHELNIFPSDSVMHFKTSFSLDGITGLPVREILKGTIKGALSSQEIMNELYENGFTAKSILEYTGDISKEQKEKLRTLVEDFASGKKNYGRVMPIPQGMRVVPIDIKLTDSQFYEMKRFGALQIAAAFGVKPNQLNDYTKSSYANSETQSLSFYVDTELFIIKQYEEEINYKTLDKEAELDGFYYKFNEKVTLRTDSKTQMSILTDAVKNGIYKSNEARRKLDLEDAEGGDELVVNGNVIPLKKVGIQYGNKGDKKGGESK